jgi:hypothetical protein
MTKPRRSGMAKILEEMRMWRTMVIHLSRPRERRSDPRSHRLCLRGDQTEPHALALLMKKRTVCSLQLQFHHVSRHPRQSPNRARVAVRSSLGFLWRTSSISRMTSCKDGAALSRSSMVYEHIFCSHPHSLFGRTPISYVVLILFRRFCTRRPIITFPATSPRYPVWLIRALVQNPSSVSVSLQSICFHLLLQLSTSSHHRTHSLSIRPVHSFHNRPRSLHFVLYTILFSLSIMSTCTYVSPLRSSIPVDPACTL